MIHCGHLFDQAHPDMYKKWVIGGFVQDPKFNSDHFEFKFQDGRKGMLRKPKPVINPNTTTLAILIDGKLRLNFSKDDIILCDRGDYVWWSPDAPHLFEYLHDSLVITLRWIK